MPPNMSWNRPYGETVESTVLLINHNLPSLISLQEPEKRFLGELSPELWLSMEKDNIER